MALAISSRSTCRRLSRQLSTSQLETSNLPSHANQPSAKQPKSHATLPPAKLRALISLYHQAETWVTPENLLQRIDAAFTPQDYSSSQDPRGEILFDTKFLRQQLTEIRNAPKMIQYMGSVKRAEKYRSGTHWSDNRPKRELKVMEALYGADVTVPGKLQPGLELVQESAKVAEKRHQQDLGDVRNADIKDLLNNSRVLSTA